MFSIDLLKGQRLPQKLDIKKSILKAVPVLIPLLAMGAVAASYQHGRTTLAHHRKAIQSNQQEIDQYRKDVLEYNKIDSRIKDMEKCRKDITKALSFRVQSSDIFVELVQNLPEQIFIYEINMDRNSVKEKIQQEGSAAVKQRLVVRRQMKLVLCGYDANQSDAAVQEYVSKLEQSPLLSDIFVEIKPAARQQGEVDGRPAVFYKINCLLQEQSS